MEGVGEAYDRRPAVDVTRHLDRALDRVRAGRPREQHLMRHAARRQNDVVKALTEGRLGRARHDAALHDAIVLDVLDQLLLHGRRVDWKRAVQGQTVSVRVELGGRQTNKKYITTHAGLSIRYITSIYLL